MPGTSCSCTPQHCALQRLPCMAHTHPDNPNALPPPPQSGRATAGKRPPTLMHVCRMDSGMILAWGAPLMGSALKKQRKSAWAPSCRGVCVCGGGGWRGGEGREGMPPR